MSPIERCFQFPEAMNAATISLAKDTAEAFKESRKAARRSLENWSNLDGFDGIVFRAIENLLWRIDEQLEGALVAFIAGCPAASETVARTVVETSVNVIYLTREHKAKRLISFFRTYVKEHGSRLKEWEAFICSLPGAQNAEVLKMIDGRREALLAFHEFVEDLATHLNLPDVPASYDWPRRLFERFKATGHDDSYWTVYHRLSGSSHGNAEETLRWLIGLLVVAQHGDDEIMYKLHLETINFSAMMLCFAVRFFVEACESVCSTYGTRPIPKEFQSSNVKLEKMISNFAKQAGVPQST